MARAKRNWGRFVALRHSYLEWKDKKRLESYWEPGDFQRTGSHISKKSHRNDERLKFIALSSAITKHRRAGNDCI